MLQSQLRRRLGKLSAQLHREDKETGTTTRAYLQHIKHHQVNKSTINPLDSDSSPQMLPDPSVGDQQEKSSSMAGTGHQENKTRTPSSSLLCLGIWTGSSVHSGHKNQLLKGDFRELWLCHWRNQGRKSAVLVQKSAALPSLLLPSPSQQYSTFPECDPWGKKMPNHQQNKRKHPQHSALLETGEKQSRLRHSNPKETRKSQ